MTLNKLTVPPTAQDVIDTINGVIDAIPTKTSELNNDSGYITGITSSDVTTALGYTPYNSTNPSGYQANVIETIKVNGTALTPTSKAVNISIPATPTVGDGDMVIQRNGTAVGTFTANQTSASTINISVPTTATEVGALPDSTVIGSANLTIKRNNTAIGTFSANATEALEIDISVPTTATEVGALPSDTVIGDGKVIFQKNGTSFSTVSANQTTTTTVNFTIPTTASDVGALPDSTTIGDGKTVFKKNGTAFATISANQTSTVNVDYTIPAAQVNSDWDASSGVAQILNKPTLATVATSGSYNDLSNKPTIPIVNDATLTIQKNGTAINTFTANASSDVIANITVPTKTSDLTNDDGFITGITSNDVTTALGYTPYDSANPNGYTSNIGTVTKVNNTSPDANGNVTISIPSAVTESTVSGWGFTKNTGTVTSVNNVAPVNGNVTLSIPSTSNLANKDLSNLSSTGEAKFQTPLVSGTNIKTINNTSILGSGNITVDADGANKDLSNLSTNGENRLHALKSYLDAGELLTDAEGLDDVTAYSHSTFDSSKFTVVGSPSITDDGVASGFSSGNYIKTQSTVTFSDNIIIQGSFTTPSSLVNGDNILAGQTNQYIGLEINTSKFTVSIGNGTAWVISSSQGTTTLNTDTKYYYKIVFDGLKYLVYLSTDNTNWTLDNTITTTQIIPACVLFLGTGRAALGGFTGSIDLKQFSITVDGVEVFSGNKTGIDTIKPDNYTVVGSPTISADGVVRGLSTSGNGLETGYVLNFTSSFELMFKVNISVINGFYVYLGETIFGVDYGKQHCWLSNSYLNDIGQIDGNTTILTNTDYYFKFGYANGSYYQKSSTDGINWINENSLSSNSHINVSEVKIGGWGGVNGLNGSIDLNSFKIYVDGNLVYQPCLKIPYTESKTGSKIVSSTYRDRVADMYEQFGSAPYYTLSDTDFTLPQGEIYGMKVDKVNLADCHVVTETYVNETSWYRVYSDGWCEQGGSGSSGTITFLKPFIDTNYTVITRMLSGSGNISWGEYGENTSKTTTTFTVGTIPVSWQACGYIN